MLPTEFSNQTTWMMAEWITSDENQMLIWDEKTKFYAQAEISNEVQLDAEPAEILAKKLKKYYLDEADSVAGYSIFNDLIRHGLNTINFEEVADILLERYRM